MPPEEETKEPEAKRSLYVNSAYGQHIMGCAELANAVCERFGVHGDDARQACFATIVIDTKERFIFESPAEKDEKAATKADAQVKEIVDKPTPEQAEAAAKTVLLDGAKRAARLLNIEGYSPALDPTTLNQFIVDNLNIDTPLERLDSEELESLIKALSTTLDNFKSNKTALSDDTDVPF